MTKEYIYLIAYCGVSLLFFVLQVIIKRKPVTNELDKVLKNLYSLLPILVFDAEQTGLTGDKKLEFAADKAISYLKKNVKMSDDEIESYRALICNQIELILSTPRKKVI